MTLYLRDYLLVSLKHLPRHQQSQVAFDLILDLIDDKDLQGARRVLGLVDATSFMNYIYETAARDTDFANEVARVIDVFGLGFAVLARPVATT